MLFGIKESPFAAHCTCESSFSNHRDGVNIINLSALVDSLTTVIVRDSRRGPNN